MLASSSAQELHPLFPSGDWEGFYAYYPGDQNGMDCHFSFSDAIITGGGSDPVGSFIWKGSYDKIALTCTITKLYSSHQVFYHGNVDENGIWGAWEMNGGRGGFHLWPKKRREAKQAMALQVEEKETSILIPISVPR